MATRNPKQFRGVFTEVLSGTVTASPAGILAGGRDITTTIATPGLSIGDAFIAYSASADPGALIVFGKCSAANVATLVFENNTAGTITPTAATTYTLIFGKLDPNMAT